MPSDRTRLPLLIATIGLHSSASTWLFNVVRELMVATIGEELVQAVYGEDLGGLPDRSTRAGQCLILKSHFGSVALDDWLEQTGAQILLSIRDPRDAVVSFSERFGFSFDYARDMLARDCDRLIRLAAKGRLLMRYEDKFFEMRHSVDQVMSTLQVYVEPVIRDAIFARYSTEATRHFANTLLDLPAGRLCIGNEARGNLLDVVTQIHSTHIGDTLSGKWRGLSADRQVELNHVFAAFLDRFGYAT